MDPSFISHSSILELWKKDILRDAQIDKNLSKGAKKILLCEWWNPQAENQTPLSSLGETIPQVQGCLKLRQTTVKQCNKNMDVLSLPILRKHKEINLLTYRVLWSKDIAHVFSLDGNVDCSKTSLSGFNETFTIPILVSRFNHFAHLHPELISTEKRQILCSILENAVWHDNFTNKKVIELTERILDPNYLLPILIGTGHDWHSTQIIFFKFQGEDFFIYDNCGNDCGIKPGWLVFKIKNKEKITPEWVQHLADRLSSNQGNYKNLEKIKKDLEANDIFYCYMKEQSVGNCTYKNLKAALYSLLFILDLDPEVPLNSQLRKLFNASPSHLRGGLYLSGTKTEKIYKQFTNFDRQVVATDLLIDLKNAIKNGENLKETDMEFLFVEVVTKAMYGKLLNTPTLIFKLGPELWKELIVSCEKVFKFSKTLDNRLLEYTDSITWESNNITNDQVLGLARLFLTQKNEMIWHGDDIIKLLMQRDILIDALREAELDSSGCLEVIKSCKNPRQFLSEYHKRLHPSDAKSLRILKLINQTKTQDLSEKFLYNSIYYLENNLFDEAQKFVRLISNTWKKTIAELNLAYHLTLKKYDSEIEHMLINTINNLSQSAEFELFVNNKCLYRFERIVDHLSINEILKNFGTLMTSRDLTRETQLIEKLKTQIYKKPITCIISIDLISRSLPKYSSLPK